MAERTATEPGTGIVHQICRPGENDTPQAYGWVTLCGQDATLWSQAVTPAQLAGLVLFCGACRG